MSVKDDLIAAKALIDTPEKWAKGFFKTENGCRCAMGAVVSATTEKDAETAAMGALVRAVPTGFGGNIAYFNDHPSTTHADIMALFDRAIATATPVDATLNGGV